MEGAISTAPNNDKNAKASSNGQVVDRSNSRTDLEIMEHVLPMTVAESRNQEYVHADNTHTYGNKCVTWPLIGQMHDEVGDDKEKDRQDPCGYSPDHATDLRRSAGYDNTLNSLSAAART